MTRKKRMNIMFLYARKTDVLDNIGGRALVIDTSVTGWMVAIDAEAANRVREAIDAAFPLAAPSQEDTPNG